MTENGHDTERKKYHVVDRRANYDEIPPEEQAQPAVAPEPADAPEPATDQQPQAPIEEDKPEEARSPQFEDLLVAVLNLVRDQALLALGMHVAVPGGFQPDLEAAQKASALYRGLILQYPDIFKQMVPEQYRDHPTPDMATTLVLAIQIIQGQSLIHMGLIADPETGLVVKKMDQAQKSIDLLAVLIEKAGAHLPPNAIRSIEGLLADLRVNYVNQLKMP